MNWLFILPVLYHAHVARVPIWKQTKAATWRRARASRLISRCYGQNSGWELSDAQPIRW
jgi:hypothetical protein